MTTGQPASRLLALCRFDRGVDFVHRIAVGDDPARIHTRIHIGKAAPYAIDDFQLTIDISGNGRGREKGLAAPGVMRQAAEPLL